MKRMTQKKIADLIGVKKSFINDIVANRKRPNWKRAKQLATVTGTTPYLWLEGTPEQIRSAVDNMNSESHQRVLSHDQETNNDEMGNIHKRDV